MDTNEFIDRIVLSKTNFLKHHECGVCGSPVGYLISDGDILFDSSCDCSSFRGNYRLENWDEVDKELILSQNPNLLEIKNIPEFKIHYLDKEINENRFEEFVSQFITNPKSLICFLKTCLVSKENNSEKGNFFIEYGDFSMNEKELFENLSRGIESRNATIFINFLKKFIDA